MEVKITQEKFETLKKGDLPLVVDLWAPWCGPCRMLSPELEKISKEEENIKICKINVDEERELARKFGISSIPTVLYAKNGEIQKKTGGYMGKKFILDVVAQLK